LLKHKRKRLLIAQTQVQETSLLKGSQPKDFCVTPSNLTCNT